MIISIIFDGNKGGDWWELYHGHKHLLGRQYLREIKQLLGGAILHRHDKVPCPNQLPLFLSDAFDANTLRWCDVTHFTIEFLREVQVRGYWFEVPLLFNNEYVAYHKNGASGRVYDVEKRNTIGVLLSNLNDEPVLWDKKEITKLEILRS